MKRSIKKFLVVFLCYSSFCSAQGLYAYQAERIVGSYSSLSIDGAIDVVLLPATEFFDTRRIVVQGKEKWVKNIVIDNTNGHLRLTLPFDESRPGQAVKIICFVRHIHEIKARNVSSVVIEAEAWEDKLLDLDKLTIKARDYAFIDLPILSVDSLKTCVYNDAYVALAGWAEKHIAKVRGHGVLYAYDLHSEEIVVTELDEGRAFMNDFI